MPERNPIFFLLLGEIPLFIIFPRETLPLIHTGETLWFFFGERIVIEITLEDMLMPQ